MLPVRVELSKAPEPLKVPKSHEQRIEEALGISRDGRLSPFDLLLNASKLRYWGYQNENFKHENGDLTNILECISLDQEGKKKMDKWNLDAATCSENNLRESK